jgi:hypothetical protein
MQKQLLLAVKTQVKKGSHSSVTWYRMTFFYESPRNLTFQGRVNSFLKIWPTLSVQEMQIEHAEAAAIIRKHASHNMALTSSFRSVARQMFVMRVA